jgi:hypothetical protein
MPCPFQPLPRVSFMSLSARKSTAQHSRNQSAISFFTAKSAKGREGNERKKTYLFPMPICASRDFREQVFSGESVGSVGSARALGVRAGRGTACRAHFNHCPGCLSCPCQLENPQNHGRFNCLNQRACRDKSMHVLEKTARKVLWLYQGNEFTCIPPSCYTFSQ